MTLEAEGNSTVTFSDLPHAEAVAWAAKMPHHSTISFAGELNYPTYKDIPSSYLFTKEDKTIPPVMQRSMVDAANELRGSPLIEYDIPSGHVPFISMPGAVVEVVRKVAGEKL
jgi:hypothetical protein